MEDLDELQDLMRAKMKLFDDNVDDLDDEEIEKRLRMLYSQFFSTDFKTS